MKILAVCGFGVGSSMILKMTIQKALKELNVEADVVNTDISDSASYKADAIFTSPQFVDDLKSRTSVPLYKIERYSDKEEVKAQIQALLDNQKQ